ncbi:hypothetical protein [Paenibacillus cymbidii]|uniref:hypothetical protein n=1 Tax=Paenibacillus cymbidii TaxID=1639034 RepID=UPI001081E541|nr:hypothetical protein [Paenibacillus cymbidii]
MDWRENLKLWEDRLPRIDRTERIMDAIRSQSEIAPKQEAQQPAAKSKRAKAGYAALMTATVIFACGFGFAADSWKLFAPDGSLALEYRSFMPGDEPVAGVDTAALQRMLAEGQAAIFYLKRQDRYIGLANERQYADYSQFAAEAGNYAPRNEIGQGFAFQSGSFIHELNGGIAGEYHAEDSKTTEEISYRTVPLGRTVGYSASYKDERGYEVALTVWFHLPGQTIYTNEMNELNMEKVRVDEAVEAFYLKGKDSDVQRISWGEGDSYYRLDDLTGGQLSRERMVELALSLIGG